MLGPLSFSMSGALGRVTAYTPVVVAPFSPADVPDLAAWFKADSLSLANNADVTAWTDSAGHGHSLSSAGTALPAVFHTAGPNGKPTVYFENPVSGSANLAMATGISTQILHAFAVVRQPDTTTPRAIFANAALGGAPEFRVYATHMDLVNASTADIGSSTGVLSNNVWYLLECSYSSPNAAFYRNGAADGTVSTATTFANPISGLGANNTSDHWSTGDLAEVLIYTRVLTGPERAAVAAWLNTKYALY